MSVEYSNGCSSGRTINNEGPPSSQSPSSSGLSSKASKSSLFSIIPQDQLQSSSASLWHHQDSITSKKVIKSSGGQPDDSEHLALACQNYADYFMPQIRSLMEYDFNFTLNQKKTSVPVDLEIHERFLLATFRSPFPPDSKEIVPGRGMILQISEKKEDEYQGLIKDVSDDEYITLIIKLPYGSKKEFPKKAKCEIRLEWVPVAMERILNGLAKFSNGEIDTYIARVLLGMNTEVEEYFVENFQLPCVEGVRNLNRYQLDAVRNALARPFTLIQGPPGTGKTVVSSVIIFNLAKTKHPTEKILVCAPSNEAVDRITQLLHACRLNIVRLCSKGREKIETKIEEISFHHKIRYQSKNGVEIRKLELLKERNMLKRKELKRLDKLKDAARDLILTNTDIVCCTCSAAADQRLANFKFKYVLIDEASQAIEPECILPLLKGAEKVVIVGDHKQLGPVVSCVEVARTGLEVSLFERLVEQGNYLVTLKEQYRMSPSISQLPNWLFYKSQLKNGIRKNFEVPLPFQGNNIMFCNISGTEARSETGSLCNELEAYAVYDFLHTLISNGVSPSQVAVITPYAFQRLWLRTLLSNNESTCKVEVSSIHTFQGKEKDYIFISCVRSNFRSIGFIKDPRIINVAITRAKKGMIIFGNATVLSENPYWHEMVKFYREKQAIYTYEKTRLERFTGRIHRVSANEEETESRVEQILEIFRRFIEI